MVIIALLLMLLAGSTPVQSTASDGDSQEEPTSEDACQGPAKVFLLNGTIMILFDVRAEAGYCLTGVFLSMPGLGAVSMYGNVTGFYAAASSANETSCPFEAGVLGVRLDKTSVLAAGGPLDGFVAAGPIGLSTSDCDPTSVEWVTQTSASAEGICVETGKSQVCVPDPGVDVDPDCTEGPWKLIPVLCEPIPQPCELFPDPNNCPPSTDPCVYVPGAPVICTAPPEPCDLVQENCPPSTDPCYYYPDAPGVCVPLPPPPPTDPCYYAPETPGVCTAPPPTEPCYYYPDAPGVCTAPPPTDPCYYFPETPGGCVPPPDPCESVPADVCVDSFFWDFQTEMALLSPPDEDDSAVLTAIADQHAACTATVAEDEDECEEDASQLCGPLPSRGDATLTTRIWYTAYYDREFGENRDAGTEVSMVHDYILSKTSGTSVHGVNPPSIRLCRLNTLPVPDAINGGDIETSQHLTDLIDHNKAAPGRI